MPENYHKVKITVEIPHYLKEWIQAHDIGQNALVTLGLRNIYKQELNQVGPHLVQQLLTELQNKSLPF